jgi:hypothetical protein
MSLPLKCRVTLLAVPIVLTVGPWQTVSAQSSTASTKPNVVFILVDNVGWGDFSFYGGPSRPRASIPSRRMGCASTTTPSRRTALHRGQPS